jgi:hypothetical protein
MEPQKGVSRIMGFVPRYATNKCVGSDPLAKVGRHVSPDATKMRVAPCAGLSFKMAEDCRSSDPK